jgi:signal transduction histidine kinase
MLGLLRDVGADPTPADHSIADLPVLVDGLQGTGLEATVTVAGVPRPLGPQVELTAYRIVQEGLTNVLRHSGAVRAEVTVTYDDAGVDIGVSDSGRGARSRDSAAVTSGGHGLVGLRERTRLLGGRLDYGPRDGVGFALEAHLPSPRPVAS